MKGLKTVYICSSCNHTSPKWMGKCPSCGAWNSFVEDVISTAPEKEDKSRKHEVYSLPHESSATEFSSVTISISSPLPSFPNISLFIIHLKQIYNSIIQYFKRM